MGTKITLKIILAIGLTFGPFISCKKRPFDHRNKYCGKWKFTYSSYAWSFGQGSCCYVNGEFEGTISYKITDKDKDLLIVNYADGSSITIDVDKNGKLKGCGSTGEIDKKTISVEYSSSGCNLALGGGTSLTIKGSKK